MNMKFDPKEIENAKVEQGRRLMIEFDSPITARENFRRALEHKQLWMPMTGDKMNFTPEIVPDNTARALVTQAKPYEGPKGGLDMFGVYWEYVPSANGSIVRPGNPTLTDITKWREVVKFPDVDSWDWEKSAREDREFLANSTRLQLFCILDYLLYIIRGRVRSHDLYVILIEHYWFFADCYYIHKCTSK